MTEDLTKDVQIHIHEHVGPLRERVGKIEGRLETNEREITLLRQSLDNLRSRIDDTKDAILDAFTTHTKEEMTRYDEMLSRGIANASKIDALRNWIIAVGVGAGVVFGVFEFLARIGAIHHGG